MDRDPACLFCKIVAGEVRSDVLHRDEDIVAFRDVNPQAPLHALIVPVRHVRTLDDLAEADAGLIARIVLCATGLAADRGFTGGYRLVWNCGPEAGQSVYHIHLHLLAGRRLAWPPG
jgi:histidine triad (HIT) family protein